MWESDWFEPKDILKWEVDAVEDQTCANLNTCFGCLYLQQKKTECVTTKGSRYESANRIKKRKEDDLQCNLQPNLPKKTEQANQFTYCITATQEAQQEKINQIVEANKVQPEVSKKQAEAQAEMMLQMAIVLKSMSNSPTNAEKTPPTGQP